MKATESTKRTAALGLSALILSSVMLCAVACTRDDHKNPGDTTAATTQDTNKPTVTTPATDDGGKDTTSGTVTDKPLDPDAGTVAPDNGTTGDEKSGRSILPRFMQ